MWGALALMVSAIFAGAALYVTFVEQPARLTLDDDALLAEWKPAYVRGAIMQASLAILGCANGLLAWLDTGRLIFLIGALVMIANWPYTLLCILPTNRALKATTPAEAGPRTRALIVKWGYVHAGRTALGCAATAVFAWALAG